MSRTTTATTTTQQQQQQQQQQNYKDNDNDDDNNSNIHRVIISILLAFRRILNHENRLHKTGNMQKLCKKGNILVIVKCANYVHLAFINCFICSLCGG